MLLYWASVLSLCIICVIAYLCAYKYIMNMREKYWETANKKEIIKTFISILHVTDYLIWNKLFLHELIVYQEITYSHIVKAYYALSPHRRADFWSYCNICGLGVTFSKILLEEYSISTYQ